MTDELRTLKRRDDRRRLVKGSPILKWSAAPYAQNKIRRENWEPIKALAQTCMERARFSTLADRDALALEFWTGAANAWRIAGFSALSEDTAKLGVLEISTRGYQAVIELALY